LELTETSATFAAGVTCTTLTASGSGIFGSASLISNERLRVTAGGDVLAMSPGATDALIGNGSAHFGGTVLTEAGLVVRGSLVAAGASRAALVMASATDARLLTYGNNTSTYGSLSFYACSSNESLVSALGVWNTTGLAVGATSALGSERLRIAGGTMGTPGAADVLLADGKIRCGNTSATSIETAGGVTAAGAVISVTSETGYNSANGGRNGFLARGSGGDGLVFGWASATYTTGGGIGWAANDRGFIYSPSNVRIGAGVGSTPAIEFGAAAVGFMGATPVTRTSLAAATGTATRTTFDTTTVTTQQLAERVKALIDDLRAYGLED
jgi:hypothetical protein